MCGIAGMMSLTGRPLERPELVQAMMERLVHRGPDEEGLYMNPSRTVSLGHRRLRIIDLATGRQPLANEDDSLMIVFNGEIYGYQAQRETLLANGFRFRTKTDTEVIVHLYDQQGLDCLQHLKGMFAFALWDERRESLLLARDRLGKKPLYYAIHQGELIFASELQALLAVPGLSREIDELALDLYLTLGYIPAPRTIYRQIQKLEAGYYLQVKPGDAQKACYWAPRSAVCEPTDWEEAKSELIRRLRTATALRMVSDVPLGCFLSGGVDSSTVLAFMAELSPRPVKTFSIGFPEEDFSELKHARLVAQHFGTDHHEYVLEPDAVSVLDELVGHLGEPFADASALPTWYLAQLTRKSVTVALTGDGGDELFGGYGWYQTGRILEAAACIPRWMAQLGSNLETLPWPRALRAAGKAAALLTRSSGERYATLREVMSPRLKARLVTAEFLARTANGALDWLTDRFNQTGTDDMPNRMMATDLATYMAEDLLVKVDRMSMAHGLECRSPFLDTDLVEWALALPSTYKVRVGVGKWLSRGGGKWVLREAMRDRFPSNFLDRPKQGFSVPLERWFRGDLKKIVTDRVLHGPLLDLGAFESSGLERIVADHFDGQSDHSATVWALLVLATWVEHAQT
jgi:asparagine synthase (glutamine-hydrolysing)